MRSLPPAMASACPGLEGRWIEGTPWQRFGLYNSYVVIRQDLQALKMPAHGGELVPGSTEDLIASITALRANGGVLAAPMTLDLDPTYACASRDCGGACFSAEYRSRAPRAQIDRPLLERIIGDFHRDGGRILRFDGGGDPLLHADVRSGRLVTFAAERRLKTTILTSGDLLDRTDLRALASAGCFLRVSLNAATEPTRLAFHGNRIPLARVMTGIEEMAGHLAVLDSPVPVGATYLLTHHNAHEVLACAEAARRAGVRHFSVRRVLGPQPLRPRFTASQRSALAELLTAVRQLHSEDFRVAVPWRDVDEADLNSAAGDICATSCWQSTFKTVIEPDPAGGARAQLCGRYRGGGVGQRQQLPALFACGETASWTARWRASFTEYGIPRPRLLRTCVSCIDGGFIHMIDRLLHFTEGSPTWTVYHLESPKPHEVIECSVDAIA